MSARGRWIMIVLLLIAIGALAGCANESMAEEPAGVETAPPGVQVEITDDYQANIDYDAQVAFGDEIEIEFRMVDYSNVPDGTTLTEDMDDTLPSQPGMVTFRLVSATATETLGDRVAYEDGTEFLGVVYEYRGSPKNPSGSYIQPGMLDVTSPTPAPLLVVRSEGREDWLIGDPNMDGLVGGVYMEDWGDGGFVSDEWQLHGAYAQVPSDSEWELALKYVAMDGEAHYILMETE